MMAIQKPSPLDSTILPFQIKKSKTKRQRIHLPPPDEETLSLSSSPVYAFLDLVIGPFRMPAPDAKPLAIGEM